MARSIENNAGPGKRLKFEPGLSQRVKKVMRLPRRRCEAASNMAGPGVLNKAKTGTTLPEENYEVACKKPRPGVPDKVKRMYRKPRKRTTSKEPKMMARNFCEQSGRNCSKREKRARIHTCARICRLTILVMNHCMRTVYQKIKPGYRPSR